MDVDAEHRQRVGRIAGGLFAAGAIASIPANELFRDPTPPSYVHIINALAALSGLICFLVPWARLRTGWLASISVMATLEVALTVWSIGPHAGVYSWYYLLIAVFIAYAYRDRRVIVGLSVLLLVAFWLPAFPGSGAGDDALPRALVGGPVLMITIWIIAFLREGLEREQAALRLIADQARHEALTDALTGLSNRRRLLTDLEAAFADGPASPEMALTVFDLNGFKSYNDTFGHPAGDALLRRLGQRLIAAAGTDATAYRLGGDEFCLLSASGSDLAARERLVAAAAAALAEHGDGFSITSSHGTALLPNEAPDAASALGCADQRMYAHKASGRLSAASQSSRVLLRLLTERQPGLGDHCRQVADLARDASQALRLSNEEIDEIVRAAELHDVGKSAIPDLILDKPGPLDDEEWAFIRRHTIIGERILLGAPALAPVARLVRASHERWDGQGYPDGVAGDQIPLGARIVAVCDAFQAMTDPERTYRAPRTRADALQELRACSGTQFDPAVVEAFCERALERWPVVAG